MPCGNVAEVPLFVDVSFRFDKKDANNIAHCCAKAAYARGDRNEWRYVCPQFLIGPTRTGCTIVCENE